LLRILAALARHPDALTERSVPRKTAMEPTMTNKNTSPSKRDTHDNNSSLDSRYGSIGISAVAAALPFTREVKNPACAPADTTPDREKLSEMAA
jgi:hypothetical protein